MINITKKEIEMSSDLITKLKWACGSNYKATNGCLRIVDHTNIAYVEPHKVIINNTLFLMFNEHEFVYVENLFNKIHTNHKEYEMVAKDFLSKGIFNKSEYKLSLKPLFNLSSSEIISALNRINQEMDESAEQFYRDNKKDDYEL